MKQSSLRAWEMLISVFVLVNLSTILFINRPNWLVTSETSFLKNHMSPYQAYSFDHAGWIVRRYAHLVGLDNQWQMFGRQSRFNWWFTIEANTAYKTNIVLPLPLQSDRTPVQALFVDIKEGKYHLNLYGNPDLRRRYAHYLCRAYPTVEGERNQSITFYLHYQMLAEPLRALADKTHYIGPPQRKFLENVPCPKEAA